MMSHSSRKGSRKYNKKMKRDLNIATWNVRTLFECGKLQQVRQEAERLAIDILGMAEVRWPGEGMIKSSKSTFYYKGEQQHQHGVGLLFSEKANDAVMKVQPVNE